MIFSFDKSVWIEEYYWDNPQWREYINNLTMPTPMLFNQNQGIVDKYGREIDRALAEHYEGYGARTRIVPMASHVMRVNVEHEGKRQYYYFEKLRDNQRQVLIRVAYAGCIDTLFIREAK